MTKKAKRIIWICITSIIALISIIIIPVTINHYQWWKEAQNMVEIRHFQQNGTIDERDTPVFVFDRRELDIYAVDRLDSSSSQIKFKFKNGKEDRTSSLIGKQEWYVTFMIEKVGFNPVPWWGTS